jgi:hypothetical protein
MPTSLPIRFRIIVIVGLVTPLLAGAAWCAVAPMSAAHSRPHVAITTNGQPTGSACERVATALTRGSNFVWVRDRPDEAARGLSDGQLLAQVAIPAALSFGTGSVGDGSIVVTQGHRGVDAATFAELVRQVSAATSMVWADDLAGALGRARNDLDTAQASATMVAASGAAANEQFNDLFEQVAEMLLRAEPMVVRAQAMLKTVSGINDAMQSIADSLGSFAASLHGVNLTIGDVQGGLDMAGQDVDMASQALVDTATLRAQVGPAVTPAVESLRANGSLDLQRLAHELDVVLFLIGGPGEGQARGLLAAGRTSTQELGGLLKDLSGMLGAPVDASTQLSRVLDLSQSQLHRLQASLADGQRTIKAVASQVLQGKQQLPTVRADIATKLNRFQEITQQLTQSLVTTRQALTGAAPHAEMITLSGAAAQTGHAAEDLVQAVLVVLIGAVGNAVGFSFLARRFPWRLPLAAAGAVVVGLGAAGAAIVGQSVGGPVFGLLTLAGAASSTLAAAVLRFVGEAAGSTALICVLAVTAWAGGRTDGAVRLLPSSYAIDGLESVMSTGRGSAIMLAIGVMSGMALGSIASCAFAQWRYGWPNPGQLGPGGIDDLDDDSGPLQPDRCGETTGVKRDS